MGYIVDIIDKVIRKKRVYLRASSLQKYYNLRAKLLKYESKIKKRIKVGDLNESLVEDYIIFLREELGNKNVTINKDLKTLHASLRTAYEMKIIDRVPESLNIRLPDDSSKRTFLSKKEVTLLFSLFFREIEAHPFRRILTEGQLHSLRTFLFCCYTGLRYSDVHGLKLRDIYEEDGIYYIYKEVQKNSATIMIPLPEEAVKLYKLYVHEDGRIFYPQRNQVINRNLKVIGKYVGIKKSLTMHVARHTYATLLLNAGVNIEVVSELLGHKKLSTTKIYAKVTTYSKREALKKFREYLGEGGGSSKNHT